MLLEDDIPPNEYGLKDFICGSDDISYCAWDSNWVNNNDKDD